MFQNILNSKFIKGSKVLGIDYFTNSHGQIDLNFVVLNRKKGQIFIEKKFTGIDSLEQLNDSEFKDLPAVLSVDGKGVLFKITEKIKNQQLIHQILPNAKTDDFYIQSKEYTQGKIIVSAIRKEIFDGIQQKVTDLGFQIIQLYIGPLALEKVSGFIEQDTFYTNKYEVIKVSDEINQITKTTESNLRAVNIGNDELYSNELLAYATALSFYISDNTEELESITESRSEFLYKKTFTIAGWFTLIFFLSLLLANYFFYSQNTKELNQLTFSYNQNRELLKKLDTLKSEYLIKEKYFVNSGFLDASRLSYFADRIANSLPKNIQLSGMNINPLNTKIKDEKILGFTTNTINISGSVNQSIVLNNWVKKIKEFDWIKNVNITEYNQEVADIPANFEIIIDLK